MMGRRDRGDAGRATLSGPAKAWLLGLAAMLVLPTAMLGLQARDDLEMFHNRVLVPWPAGTSFRRDPSAWFAQANRWLADRVYPIVAAIHLRNNLAYFALHASPTPNITVGRDGFVFLNGTDAEHENDLVRSACAEAAAPGAQAAVEEALGRLAAFGRRSHLAVDVLMVPTVPVLYGDRLPRSFPPALRAACRAGRGPLTRIRAPEGLRFVYPFDEMSALRGDPAMFPLGNFHPEGLSVKIAADSYLRAIGASVPANRSVTLASAPSEVLADYGVLAPFPVYAVSDPGSDEDTGTGLPLRAALRPFYNAPDEANVYRNPAAPNPAGVLILSDSYGVNEAISLSAAFRTVVQTAVPSRDPAGLMAVIRGTVPFDRLLLVFNDGNVGKVIDLARKLAAEDR